MSNFQAFSFKQWIEDHRDLLKPPVGNKMVFEEASDFIVMVVGGPNARKDFHYNEGEEFFYQIEGDIVLKVMDGDKVVDIPIREGDIYLLPPKVPHSPQRPANTVGLVIERKRHAGEQDGFQWYCEKCGQKLYDEYFELKNIVTQLPPVMNRFFANEAHRTCKSCGEVMAPPK